MFSRKHLGVVALLLGVGIIFYAFLKDQAYRSNVPKDAPIATLNVLELVRLKATYAQADVFQKAEIQTKALKLWRSLPTTYIPSPEMDAFIQQVEKDVASTITAPPVIVTPTPPPAPAEAPKL
jgi:hypothetical protein